MVVSEEDQLTTAYHEGGHALTSLLTKGATPLHKVTILPRNGALGYVISRNVHLKDVDGS
jgi:ATP-dependent metalloprotease